MKTLLVALLGLINERNEVLISLRKIEAHLTIFGSFQRKS